MAESQGQERDLSPDFVMLYSAFEEYFQPPKPGEPERWQAAAITLHGWLLAAGAVGGDLIDTPFYGAQIRLQKSVTPHGLEPTYRIAGAKCGISIGYEYDSTGGYMIECGASTESRGAPVKEEEQYRVARLILENFVYCPEKTAEYVYGVETIPSRGQYEAALTIERFMQETSQCRP